AVFQWRRGYVHAHHREHLLLLAVSDPPRLSACVSGRARTQRRFRRNTDRRNRYCDCRSHPFPARPMEDEEDLMRGAVKVTSRHFLNGRSHPSLSKEGTSAFPSVVFNAPHHTSSVLSFSFRCFPVGNLDMLVQIDYIGSRRS